MKKKLFVYGSLRKGELNYKHYFNEKVEYLGKGYIKEYSLYSLGAFPVIFPGNYSSKVIGEVYCIPKQIFRRIYNMETHAGYQSEDINVFLDNNTQVLATCFVFTHFYSYAKIIPHGDWVKYLQEEVYK